MSSPCCCCCMFWPAQPPLFLREIMLVYMLLWEKNSKNRVLLLFRENEPSWGACNFIFNSHTHARHSSLALMAEGEKSLWWWWWVIKMVRAQKVKTWEILQCRPGTTLCFFFAIDEIEIENILLTRESFIIKFFTPWLLRVALLLKEFNWVIRSGKKTSEMKWARARAQWSRKICEMLAQRTAVLK